jgi:hypothetical protein
LGPSYSWKQRGWPPAWEKLCDPPVLSAKWSVAGLWLRTPEVLWDQGTKLAWADSQGDQISAPWSSQAHWRDIGHVGVMIQVSPPTTSFSRRFLCLLTHWAC